MRYTLLKVIISVKTTIMPPVNFMVDLAMGYYDKHLTMVWRMILNFQIMDSTIVATRGA